MKKIKLNNGYEIPCIGYGTWQSPDGEITEKSVKFAIQNGYTHIDTAAAYKNEQSVGRGIKEAEIKREELFITSKVWNADRGYEKTKKAFYKTLSDLDFDYLDLYLIHWPAASNQFKNWDEINLETWKAMTELYKEGKIKAIGVSNFKQNHLKSLMKTEVVPMVNQIEFHPGLLQEKTVRFCVENNIAIEAWSPIGSGRLLENELLREIAEKYNKSVAQICIKWCLQNKTIPLPKSVTESRIIENMNVFDFEILKEDMDRINNMSNVGGSGLDPDSIDF